MHRRPYKIPTLQYIGALPFPLSTLGASLQSELAFQTNNRPAATIVFRLSPQLNEPSQARNDGVRTLYHYTSEEGLAGILRSVELNPSLKEVNPKDARHGNGQYLSDIAPGLRTSTQLSRDFLGTPFHRSRFTHFIEIDVVGLILAAGRQGVFVVPNQSALDLHGRIIRSGKVPIR